MSNFINTETKETEQFKTEDLLTTQFYIVCLRNLTEKIDEYNSICRDFIKINIFGNVTDFLYYIIDKYDE